MSINPSQFTFGDLGSRIDTFLDEMEKRATTIIPQTESICTAVKNTIPNVSRDFNVDIYENDTDIVIVCELPGFEKEQVSLKMTDETTLIISTKVKEETETVSGTCHQRERRCESSKRTLILPAPVKTEGARATFKNGIMEITLPKVETETGTTIPIE